MYRQSPDLMRRNGGMLEGCERDRQKQKKPQTVFAGVVIGQGHADAKDQIFSRNFGYKNF